MALIRPVTNLREYFMHSVAKALRRNDVDVDEHTSYYVVDLLTLYSRSESLFEQGKNGLELKPVAQVLADAIDGNREQVNRALKRVGDQSLFIAGFFGEGLASRLVDVDYYVNMGGSAYAALARVGGRSRADLALGPVFEELAAYFVELVDVLTDLRAAAASDQLDLLRLYETWALTGSPRAARLLRANGIEPQQELRERKKPH